MKKFLLFSAAILTMLAASCKNDGKEDQKDPNQVQEAPQAPATMQTQEYIEGRINDIYETAFKGGDDMFDLDKEVFTPDFYELQEKVLEKQNKTCDVLIDHDHWVMGQDCMNPSFKFIKADEITPTSAKVYLEVKAFEDQEKPVKVRLTLQYDGDDWMIADIEEDCYDNPDEYYSHRQEYEEYLKK